MNLGLPSWFPLHSFVCIFFLNAFSKLSLTSCYPVPSLSPFNLCVRARAHARMSVCLSVCVSVSFVGSEHLVYHGVSVPHRTNLIPAEFLFFLIFICFLFSFIAVFHV